MIIRSKEVEEFKSQADLAYKRSMRILINKNTERGGIFKEVGYKGAFLEMRTCLARLRNKLWENDPPTNNEEYEEWYDEVMNSLADLRNFSILAEICVNDNNSSGEGYNHEF